MESTVDDPRYTKLRKFNAAMGLFHFIQAVLMVLVSNSVSLPIRSNFLYYDEVARTISTKSEVLFELPIGLAVAAFLFMSALAHCAVASPWLYPWYVRNLEKKINYARWIEYSFSASWMLVIIALLVGIFDFGTLILIFVASMVMNLCGMLMEMRNQDRKEVDWAPFYVGCIAGLVPWVVIIAYFVGAIAPFSDTIPPFVYLIIVSLFITFNVFPLNMILQYRKKGKWADYLVGERGYILLSLFAKSILAWQVWSGTLRG
jgi:hypothetical protein